MFLVQMMHEPLKKGNVDLLSYTLCLLFIDLLYICGLKKDKYVAMFICICVLFSQHKVLLRQFSSGEERLAKKQPIRSFDDSEYPYVYIYMNSLEFWGEKMCPYYFCVTDKYSAW